MRSIRQGQKRNGGQGSVRSSCIDSRQTDRQTDKRPPRPLWTLAHNLLYASRSHCKFRQVCEGSLPVSLTVECSREFVISPLGCDSPHQTHQASTFGFLASVCCAQLCQATGTQTDGFSRRYAGHLSARSKGRLPVHTLGFSRLVAKVCQVREDTDKIC